MKRDRFGVGDEVCRLLNEEISGKVSGAAAWPDTAGESKGERADVSQANTEAACDTTSVRQVTRTCTLSSVEW